MQLRIRRIPVSLALDYKHSVSGENLSLWLQQKTYTKVPQFDRRELPASLLREFLAAQRGKTAATERVVVFPFKMNVDAPSAPDSRCHVLHCAHQPTNTTYHQLDSMFSRHNLQKQPDVFPCILEQ